MAVGTELLLGQIADTNSAWLGEHLAANGVASHFHQAVGDNHDRIVLALRTALARSDGVIMCGGLGPTQDDITREAIAEVMNVPLVRNQAIVDLHRRLLRGPRTDHDGQQRPPGRRPRGRHDHPAGVGDGTRAHLPDREQGRLRRAGRPLRDGRDVRARHPARLARPHGRGGRGGRHRQPRAAHLGCERVRAGRGAPGPNRCARCARRRHARLPRLGHRGDQGPHHRPGPHARRRHRPPRQGGGRGAPRHRRAPRRHRLRRRRRVDGGRRRPPPDRARSQLRRGRVADRRPHRLPLGQRAGCLGLVPRRRRRLRLAGQVRRPGGARRAGGHRIGGGGHGRGCRPGDRGRRRPRHHRRGRARGAGGRGARAPSSSASPCPASRL